MNASSAKWRGNSSDWKPNREATVINETEETIRELDRIGERVIANGVKLYGRKNRLVIEESAMEPEDIARNMEGEEPRMGGIESIDVPITEPEARLLLKMIEQSREMADVTPESFFDDEEIGDTRGYYHPAFVSLAEKVSKILGQF